MLGDFNASNRFSSAVADYSAKENECYFMDYADYFCWRDANFNLAQRDW